MRRPERGLGDRCGLYCGTTALVAEGGGKTASERLYAGL